MSGGKFIQLCRCFCKVAVDDIMELKLSAPPLEKIKMPPCWCVPDKEDREAQIQRAVEFQRWEDRQRTWSGATKLRLEPKVRCLERLPGVQS